MSRHIVWTERDRPLEWLQGLGMTPQLHQCPAAPDEVRRTLGIPRQHLIVVAKRLGEPPEQIVGDGTVVPIIHAARLESEGERVAVHGL
jgi:hypothetical protein